MSSRRQPLKQPRDYLLSRGEWPSGPFEADAPVELEFYVGIVGRLIQVCGDKKENEGKEVPDIARDAKLSNQTVYNILQGKSWCELLTIYRLEKALNAQLWHHKHVTGP